MRVTLLAFVLLVSTPAVAQPTTEKPPETSPTGTTSVPTIKVTTKKFASLSAGKKLTQAGLKKVFPKAKLEAVKGKDPHWKIDGANGLVVRANTQEIIVLGGPVEVHGVMIGDDGKELSGGNFRGAYCWIESEGRVSCDKDALRVVLEPCGAKEDGGSVPLGAVAGCKVLEIRWIAYAPRA